MRKNSSETEQNQAEKSVEICRFNIDNQKRKLEEINSKLDALQKTLNDNKVLSPNEQIKLLMEKDRLMLSTNRLNGLIKELVNELTAAEKRLGRMKFASSSEDLTSREAGSIGGNMVQKMVEAFEKNL